jgi:hypothetical protein
MSFEQVAAVPIAGMTALQALRDAAHLQAGQKVATFRLLFALTGERKAQTCANAILSPTISQRGMRRAAKSSFRANRA